jgi:predicted lipoprotein with Yx(FWY)xxD motif
MTPDNVSYHETWINDLRMTMKSKLLTLFFVLPVFPVFAATLTQETPLGQVYTDAAGHTLYTFSKDAPGKSACQGACLQKWPPYLVEDPDTNRFTGQPGFSQIQRSDGRKQWAKNEMPLYRWFKDTRPGEAKGAGLKGVWPIARADDVTLKAYNTGKQRFLVDNHNLTLYTFDKDTPNQSNCYHQCAVKWPPAQVNPQLVAQGVDTLKLTGGFGVIQRKDKTYQWTYRGQPLYRWFKDKNPGDTRGDNIKNVWHIISF